MYFNLNQKQGNERIVISVNTKTNWDLVTKRYDLKTKVFNKRNFCFVKNKINMYGKKDEKVAEHLFIDIKI